MGFFIVLCCFWPASPTYIKRTRNKEFRVDNVRFKIDRKECVLRWWWVNRTNSVIRLSVVSGALREWTTLWAEDDE